MEPQRRTTNNPRMLFFVLRASDDKFLIFKLGAEKTPCSSYSAVGASLRMKLILSGPGTKHKHVSWG